MKQKSLMSFLTVVSFFVITSCVITKTPVGSYKEEAGEPYTYAKGRQLSLFWGIVPLGRTSVSTPADGSCEVITKRNFGDGLITYCTAGIVTSYTIKIKDKRIQ